MSFSSSKRRRQRKGTGKDRLSALPDSLLIRILSFLDTDEAARTTVLSKRWKSLWVEIPRLDFWDNCMEEKTTDFVSRVTRILDSRTGNHLDKFQVTFNDYRNNFASNVDNWVKYCVKNEVKQLSLILNPYDKCYTPPRIMYSCSSLTALHLKKCIMAHEGTIGWQSLTDLTLSDVELSQHLLDGILASCPVLKRLELEGCWGFTSLKVDSRCLDSLKIEEPKRERFLEITAPYVTKLDITVSVEDKKWRLRNISSVVKAYVNFFEFDCDCDCDEEVMSNALKFLDKFKRVKELYVASQCFEVLSKMTLKGWELPKFRVQSLSLISPCGYESRISGTIGMLNLCPNLETLVLEEGMSQEVDEEGYFTEEKSAKYGVLDRDLLHLKKIRVHSFADPNVKPLLTLARILLGRTPALEKMMVVVDVERRRDLVCVKQTLLSYPKSSPKAEIRVISCDE